jgi:hypothetical protein
MDTVSTLVVILKSGHLIPEKQPEALADTLRRFLIRVDPKRGAAI